MQFVQVVLTDDQALLARAALDLILNDPERYVMTDEERADYERLAVFLGHVAQNPSEFPVTGKMATSVRKAVRRIAGPAQPQSRRRKRSQGQQKRDRKARRELVAAYNEAVARMEAERQEAEEAHRELLERIEPQPKYRVVSAGGEVILDGVPAEFIQPVDEDGPAITRDKIVLAR